MAVSLRIPLFGLIIAVESFERKENTDQAEQRAQPVHAAPRRRGGPDLV